MNELEVMDPTAEREGAERPRAVRPESLEGLTLGLIDIAKRQSDVFLDRLQELLLARGHRVKRFRKPTFARVMPEPLRQEIVSTCNAVVEALAD